MRHSLAPQLSALIALLVTTACGSDPATPAAGPPGSAGAMNADTQAMADQGTVVDEGADDGAVVEQGSPTPADGVASSSGDDTGEQVAGDDGTSVSADNNTDATDPSGVGPDGNVADGSSEAMMSDAQPDDGAGPMDDADPMDDAVPGGDDDAMLAATGILLPARVEAEDFVRFYEEDAPNDVGDCGEGPVDMGETDDDAGRCYVGWTQAGEWLEYDVWSPDDSVFDLSVRVASEDAGRTLEVLVDGEVLGEANAPGAGWTTFQTVKFGAVSMTAGAHVVRVRFVSGQLNINYLTFAISGAELVAEPTPDDVPTDEPADPTVPDPTGGDCSEAPDGYTLAWADEFDYEGLPDPERWGYETGGNGWGNNELQNYTADRLENASVADGMLTITAINESYQGNTYTSAKLNSGLGGANAGTWNEGIFSIRARLPAGLGTWPALWMMPTQCTEGWPNCGEIDIMEHVGYDEGVVHGTIHTDAFNHVEGTQNGKSVTVRDATSTFHTYTLVWTTERIEWQMDGTPYHSVDRLASWGFAEWPFNEKQWHLMINLAVGGDWGGAQGVDAADFPASFEVDSVCVYQR